MPLGFTSLTPSCDTPLIDRQIETTDYEVTPRPFGLALGVGAGTAEADWLAAGADWLALGAGLDDAAVESLLATSGVPEAPGAALALDEAIASLLSPFPLPLPLFP
jgi:hypothetical protein